MTARHGHERMDELLRAIDELVIYSLKSVQKTIINDKHCFEMYGYDIMLDVDLKPWLLEVNASPSLTASSPVDYDLKFRLLDDLLNVIDMENRLTGKEKRIGQSFFVGFSKTILGFDLHLKKTLVVSVES